MTATDELRRLLDERGTEYSMREDSWAKETYWIVNHNPYRFSERSEYGTCVLHNITPEQAIAATLGRGECQATMHLVELDGADGTVRKYRTSHYDTECGRELFWPGKLPPYCPYCGKRVERR